MKMRGSKHVTQHNGGGPGSLSRRIAKRAHRAVRGAFGGRAGHFHEFEVSREFAAEHFNVETPLAELFFDHEGRSIWKWPHYLPAYDEHLGRFRAGFRDGTGALRPVRLLELGVLHGGSLQLWRKYFGPDAVVFGIDINPQVAALEDPDYEVRIGSQDDPQFLADVVAEMGGVDIVIDDGSHFARHQRASFLALFPLVSVGGVYVVEDLHTSYWWDYGGAYGRGSSFIELTKNIMDDMHGWYHGHGDRLGIRARTTVGQVALYDSLVFIHKTERPRPVSTEFGQKAY